eukprot:50746-Eustigmatos_ZCMA.PRE.1
MSDKLCELGRLGQKTGSGYVLIHILCVVYCGCESRCGVSVIRSCVQMKYCYARNGGLGGTSTIGARGELRYPIPKSWRTWKGSAGRWAS